MPADRALSVSTLGPVTPRPLRKPTFDTLQVPQSAASSHYSARARQSLYGAEDRIVIDPGSRLWKVGFSGEGSPRDVFPAHKPVSFTTSHDGIRTSLWNLDMGRSGDARQEEERALEERLKDRLRKVFFQSLMADPKARKVIIVENPLLPICVKNMIARLLFKNLQVPTISFTSSGLLALISVGRTTGLVLDIGHLETTAVPFYSGRPLYSLVRTTPLAGARLSSHLRDLLLLFGGYCPPLTLNVPVGETPAAMGRVPEEVLTDDVVENVKVRCCFVDSPVNATRSDRDAMLFRDQSAGEQMDVTLPEPPSNMDISVFEASASESTLAAGSPLLPASESNNSGDASGSGPTQLHTLQALYSAHSSCTDVHVPLRNRGTLFVPGWIRSRAAELLLSPGDIDELSIPELLLDCLSRVPLDIRKEIAGSVLVIGGTAGMRGLIGRIQEEIMRTLSTRPHRTTKPDQQRRAKRDRDRWAALRNLRDVFGIVNHPDRTVALRQGERAPGWAPGCMAWVGGSLAGAMNINGEEIVRERYEEVEDASRRGDDESDSDGDAMEVDELRGSRGGYVLPDWTRTPLPVGPPNAAAPPLTLRAVMA